MAKSRPKLTGVRLRLYVAGAAPNSLLAVANAKAICARHFAGRHVLEIVDVIAHPLRALADGVVVTPTLIKRWPRPLQRLIGNLAEEAVVLATLVAR